MNMLPSMLIAATLIGGSLQVNIPYAGNNTGIGCKPEMSETIESVQGQYSVGSVQELLERLQKWGIDTSFMENCLKPIICPGGGNTPEERPEEKPEQNPEQKPDVPEDGSSDKEESEALSFAEQVVELVNAERAKVNLPALTMTTRLNEAALVRAKETVQSFSHTRPNGSSFSAVLKENGISFQGAGENIAWGQRTPEQVVNAWMNSEGHRANILNPRYTSIGVGYYLNGATPYWAQLFTY